MDRGTEGVVCEWEFGYCRASSRAKPSHKIEVNFIVEPPSPPSRTTTSLFRGGVDNKDCYPASKKAAFLGFSVPLEPHLFEQICCRLLAT